METQEYLVRIGDRVTGKRTGQLLPSTVFGIVTADFYLSKMSKIQDISKWDELYPDWKESLIVLSMFDEPQRSVSINETWQYMRENSEIFRMLEQENVNKEILNKIVNERWNAMPLVDSVAYPIDDVEIL